MATNNETKNALASSSDDDDFTPTYNTNNDEINKILATIFNDVPEDNESDYAKIYDYIKALEANQKKKRTKKVKVIETKVYKFRDGERSLSKKAVKYLAKKGCLEEDYDCFKVSKIDKKMEGFSEKATASSSGGNKNKDKEIEGGQKCLYYDLDATDLSGNPYFETNARFGGGGTKMYYKPSKAEVKKFRDKDECKNCAKTWNSATAHAGSMTNKCCRRLKAFKEIKVCIYTKRDIKNAFKKTHKLPNGKDFTIKSVADLAKFYKFSKKDLEIKEGK